MNIKENLEKIQETIAQAAQKSGRSPQEITLVAVTKTMPVEIIKQAISYGIRIIGENKIQEAKTKKAAITEEIKWHMIGHLQTNKVKDAVQIFDLIHSVDSLKLALEINKKAADLNKIMPILLEVNISQEPSKYGLTKDDTSYLLEKIAHLNNIKIKGLMTMAPYEAPETEIRKIFSELRELKNKIREQKINNIAMDYLSMGMSSDYHLAIEEGANMVRIGSALFS